MMPAWDARIRRATELSSVYPSAYEGLRFYSQVAAAQRSLCQEFAKTAGKHARTTLSPPLRSLRDQLDVAAIAPRFCVFLKTIEPAAPPPLVQAAAALLRQGAATWRSLIEDFWRREPRLESADIGPNDDTDAGGANIAERSLIWLFLQPYAEYLAEQRGPAPLHQTPSTCPLCGAKPIVGVLRPEGDGAKKSLVCMLCAHEWLFRRIYCPACGEEREPRMAFFSAPDIPHVRVDVCDTCRTYMKSVDLTKTGRAVPIVDELASLPLDLWARENGYRKLQINMLGI
jgi:formate dehydrogenase maturation protein FdhE